MVANRRIAGVAVQLWAQDDLDGSRWIAAQSKAQGKEAERLRAAIKAEIERAFPGHAPKPEYDYVAYEKPGDPCRIAFMTRGAKVTCKDENRYRP